MKTGSNSIELETYDEDVLTEVKIAGGSIVEAKPCFSADSRVLCVVTDGKVQLYNTVTGEPARCLETAAPLVDVCPDPSDHRRVSTVDIEGTTVVWDYQLGTSLTKQTLPAASLDGSTVEGIRLPAGASAPYLLLRRSSARNTARLVRVNHGLGSVNTSRSKSEHKAKSEKDVEVEADAKKVGPVVSPAGGGHVSEMLRAVRRGVTGCWQVEFGNEGRMVAAIVEPTRIVVKYIWRKDEKTKKQQNLLRTDQQRRFTCIACHPTAPVVAAGDTSGRLVVWRRLLAGAEAAPPIRTVLHWHTLPLPSVAFSPHGTFVVSGGGECVLVYWQRQSEKPAFLPRLGMPIRHVTVAPNGQLVATAHTDNVIRLVGEQRQVRHLLRGLSWSVVALADPADPAAPAPAGPATGLVYEPRSAALLLNGAVGHLQLFSPRDRRDLYSLDVVQTNYLTGERTDSPVTCDVTRVAVTSCGDWLATVEERDDGGQSPAESRLKFWAWHEESQGYVLNTCVDEPHDGPVTALLLRPADTADDSATQPLAVTVGTDGAVKYWSLVDDSDIYGSRRCWSCDAVGSHRGLPAGCAAFSPDGRRLAVGFAAAVTVWCPDLNQLAHTLSHVTMRDTVRQLAFGGGACSQLVVARTEHRLLIWSLDTLTLTARIDARLSLLVADPGSEYMAAFTSSRKVFVFRPSSSRPVHQATLQRRVVAACFVPQPARRRHLPEWQAGAQLYFLTDQQALHTLDRQENAAVAGTDDVIIGQVTPTPFSALLAERHRSAVTPGQHKSQSEVTPDLQSALQMLECPSHTLPPLTRICDTFIESMLYPCESEPDPSKDGDASAAAAAAPVDTSPPTASRSGSALHARLDHLLHMDMSWLSV